MKQIIPGILLSLSLAANAQTIKLSGKIARFKTAAVVHLTNNASNREPVDVPIRVGADGQFSVVLPSLHPGFYSLTGVGELYLEPGYALTVGLDKDSNTVFAGKGGLENNLGAAARRLVKGYFPMSEDDLLFAAYKMEPDSFMHTLDAYKTAAYVLLDQSSSDWFKKIEKKDIDFYCIKLLGSYETYYGIDSAKQQHYYDLVSQHAADSATFKASMAMRVKMMPIPKFLKIDSLCHKAPDWNDSALFDNSAQYREVLSEMITFSLYQESMQDLIARKDPSLLKLKAVKKHIGDPHIRNYYLYSFTADFITMSKDSVLKDSLYEDFMAHSTEPVYRSKLKVLHDNNIYFADHTMAPDFSYADVGGRNVALKNLRGQYVYIDIWATWCGPCKGEIPFLAKVEEDYGGRNIRFVSVSVDVPSDKGKWQEFVKKNQLKGLQLMADNAFDSGFIKKFNINSIPRFILIDPDGRIVSANAKRPSDPTLRSQLDGLPHL